MKLVIASSNRDKIKELDTLLSELPVTVIPLSEFGGAPKIVEDGRTFRENACKKAIGIARFTGLHAVADDSGLCVDALGGRPGIYSARYAGPGAGSVELCKKVLKELRSVKDEHRTAHFHCSIVMAGPEGEAEVEACGTCYGRITRQIRGGRGFGYDPVFLFPQAGKTFAQMRPEEKHIHSHRGLAVRDFKNRMEAYLRRNEKQK